jgi:hypothetical protein
MSIEGNLNHQPDQRQQKSKKRHTSVISCLGNLGKLRNTKGDCQPFHLQKANRDCVREDELQHPSSGRSGDMLAQKAKAQANMSKAYWCF